MSRNDLKNALLDRAEGKLPSDDDCFWAEFDYLKLRETLEAIVLCMEATTQQMESPPDLSPTESQPDATPRIVISNDRPENGEAPPLEEPQEPAA
jgi:hypothetical protein